MIIQKLFETHDGIEWKSKNIWAEANTVVEKRNAIGEISKMLCLIADDYVRDSYVDLLSKKLKESKKAIAEAVKNARAESGRLQVDDEDLNDLLNKLPKEVDQDEWMRYGFYDLVDTEKKHRTGYYFNEGRGREQEKRANFVMKPLFHLYGDTDNKKVVSVHNGYDEAFVEIPSDGMVKLDSFVGKLVSIGHFLFEGNRAQLLAINRKIGLQFPITYELHTLGWQSDGDFFAYADCVVKDKIMPFDELGLVKVGGTNFYSPSVSKVHSALRKNDKRFHQDKFLNYKKSPIDFEEWAKLFQIVYGENAPIGIATTIMACYVDLIAAIDGNAPLLYMYGEKGSGKSKFAESISSFFFVPNPFARKFNLNSGTDFAFASFKERFANTFTLYNEYDDKAIQEHWFQQLKGAFDREGRERGLMGARNKVEIQEVTGLLGLVGQYITNRDDNSLLSRSIVLHFAPNEKRTDAQVRAYDRLKDVETQGINSLVADIMVLREYFVKNYKDCYDEVLGEMRDYCTKFNARWHDRIFRNYTHLLAVVKCLEKEIKFPFKYAEFFKDITKRASGLVRVLSNSDTLSEFWRIVVSMADSGQLIRGYHYRIETLDILNLRDSKEKICYDVPKKVLLLRFESVYTLYKKAYRAETGKEAMGQESFHVYLKNRDYWIGPVTGFRFRGKDDKGKTRETSPTSSYAMDYEMMERMDINLDFSPEDAPENIEAQQSDNPFAEEASQGLDPKEIFEKLPYKD